MSLFRYNPEIHDHPEFGRGQHGYDPNQPRVPKGHSDGGQWTSGGGGEAPLTRFAALQSDRVADDGAGPEARKGAPTDQRAYLDESPTTKPATANPPGTPVPRIPGTPAAQPQAPKPKIGVGAWGVALELFKQLSPHSRPDRPVAIEFNIRAREYPRDEDGKTELDFKAVRVLRPDEVQKFCPRLWQVQYLTNETVRLLDRVRPDVDRGAFGSAVHTLLKLRVERENDPDFKAEISYLKTPDMTRPDPFAPAGWGEKNTRRLDILENVREQQTVCIYDVKTSGARFTVRDMNEIANTARHYFPDAKSFVLIEVKSSVPTIERR